MEMLMTFTTPRMRREAATVEAMIRLYCRDEAHLAHDESGLCTECESLLAYANLRLEKCPFQEGKTTCAKCPVHCYKPAQRASIRKVMRKAGPRMLTRYPIMTIQHLIDGLRNKPVKQPSRRPKPESN